MGSKRGFTLIELVVAMFIFGAMLASLTTIYSTATRHMYQDYRQNFIKTNTLVAMRAIQQRLLTATRIEVPSFGGEGSFIAFASNIDNETGCYPISPDDPIYWHYFCANTANNKLYYYSAEVPAPDGSCASAAPPVWLGIPPIACGSDPGGVLLLSDLDSPGEMFSRKSEAGAYAKDMVVVRLKVYWNAANAGLSATQRDVAQSLRTVVKINRAVCFYSSCG